jgi:hypothetical protein
MLLRVIKKSKPKGEMKMKPGKMAVNIIVLLLALAMTNVATGTKFKDT